MADSFRKCDWNPSMVCRHPRCPMANAVFVWEIERWAIGHDGVGLAYDPVYGSGKGRKSNAVEAQMLKRARINNLFDEGKMVLDYLHNGGMTPEICRELMRGERRYRDMAKREWMERHGEIR